MKPAITFRTITTADAYHVFRKERTGQDSCPLCNEKPIATFNHWVIVPNRFPYDAIANVHHMIMPREHIIQAKVTKEAWAELASLKQGYLNDHYDVIMESLPSQSSIPKHFHLHLIVALAQPS